METLAPSRTIRSGRTAVVAALLTAGAVTAAANLLLRPVPALDFGAYATMRAERDAVWLFSLLGGVGTAVAYIAAGLATCLLIRHKGAPLATIAAVLTGLAGVLFCAGFFAVGAVGWYLTSDAAGGALFESFQSDSGRVFGIQAIGFLLSVLGFVVLGVALWRSRAVPRWLAAAVPLSQIAMIAAGAGGRLRCRSRGLHGDIGRDRLVRLAWPQRIRGHRCMAGALRPTRDASAALSFSPSRASCSSRTPPG